MGKIWDRETWRLLNTLTHVSVCGTVHSVAISKDETRVFTFTEDCCIQIWNVESGNCIQHDTAVQEKIRWLLGSYDHRNKLTVRKNGQQLILCSWDKNLTILTFENKCDAEEEYEEVQGNDQYRKEDINLESAVTCIDMSADEAMMVTGHKDGTLQLWDATTMTPINGPLATSTCIVTCVTFNRESTKIVSGKKNGEIVLRYVTGKSVCSPFTTDSRNSDICSIINAKLIEKDNNIVSCSSDGTVRLWKMHESTFEEVKEPIYSNISSVAYSADKCYIVTGHLFGELNIWDGATGQLI